VIEPLDDMPDGVVGFRASGRVSGEQYDELLAPVLHEAVDRGDHIHAVLEIGPEFEEIDSGALLEDVSTWDIEPVREAALGRLALITDVSWVSRYVRMFGWAVPGDLKVFSNAERDAGVAWAAETVTRPA
jgi:hypothetical protein